VRAEAVLEMIATASVDVTFLTVLAVGGARVASGNLGIGDLVAFLLYVTFLRDPIERLSFAVVEVAEGLAAVRRIEALRALPAEAEDLPTKVSATERATRNGGNDELGPEVRFDGVWFGYYDQPVLRDVSFVASRGLTVLVGPSGAARRPCSASSSGSSTWTEAAFCSTKSMCANWIVTSCVGDLPSCSKRPPCLVRPCARRCCTACQVRTQSTCDERSAPWRWTAG
jgi:hypothetical protein